MNNILNDLGFIESRTLPKDKQPIKTVLKIREGYPKAAFIMSKSDASLIEFGDYVDFGVNDHMEIAICKGDTRKIQDYSSGRRQINMSGLYETFKSMFPVTFFDMQRVKLYHGKLWKSDPDIYYEIKARTPDVVIFKPCSCLAVGTVTGVFEHHYFSIEEMGWTA